MASQILRRNVRLCVQSSRMTIFWLAITLALTLSPQELSLRASDGAPFPREKIASRDKHRGNPIGLKDAFLRRLCRRLPYLYGFEDPDHAPSVTKSMDDVLKPPTFQSLSSKANVRLKFSYNEGNLLPFTVLETKLPDAGTDLSCDHSVNGTVFVHRDWWFDARSHFIYDHFPVIAWLRAIMDASFSRETFQFNTFTPDARKVLLLDAVEANREFLQFFDPGFENTILWVERDSTVCVNGMIYYPTYSVPHEVVTSTADARNIQHTAIWHVGSLLGRPPMVRSYGSNDFVELARSWIAERAEHIVDQPLKPIILFYVRGNWTSGRVMDELNDDFLFRGLQAKVLECGRTEEIVKYTGMDSEGKPLSQKEQFLLFHAASLVVGPHGGATASILFMSGGLPAVDQCQNRPQVIEYIPGPRSRQVHYIFASYWSLYFSADWAEYHLIQFAENSTKDITYVTAEDWNLALSTVFSQERCAVSLFAKRRPRK
jgi:hypothetical protein